MFSNCGGNAAEDEPRKLAYMQRRFIWFSREPVMATVRIAMIANTLMLGMLCLAMILTARRLRGGQTRLADAFFPLVYLHLGH
jgi:hypothetical protein